jgi:hypothetical protein
MHSWTRTGRWFPANTEYILYNRVGGIAKDLDSLTKEWRSDLLLSPVLPGPFGSHGGQHHGNSAWSVLLFLAAFLSIISPPSVSLAL